MPSDIIQDPAKTHPAGIHSVEHVGRRDVSMGDAECDGVERDLEQNVHLPLGILLERHLQFLSADEPVI